jgi:fumarylacetoacetate (FAA) hydrolase family protein
MSGVCDPSGDALTFPVGAVLLTGRSIVPDESFSLRLGDVVTIDIPGIGTLTSRSSASAGV